MNIHLSSKNYHVTIYTLGAELKSFQNPSGKEFIWNSNPEFWMRSSPLLFPTIGNVRGGKTIINNSEYSMPKHGFCKDMEFTLQSKSDTSATFLLTDSEETLKHYPFHFELQLTYKLCGNKLSMTYQVFNRDHQDIFYHIGAHPGFMCPLEEHESLSDYRLEFAEEENFDATIYDLDQLCFLSKNPKHLKDRGTILPLRADMFNQDAIFFPHTNSHSVKLINPSTGKGIHMSYPDFCSIAFWTLPEGRAPFLCLEPWNGSAIYDDEDNIFCHKRDIVTLAPKDSAIYHLEIELLD